MGESEFVQPKKNLSKMGVGKSEGADHWGSMEDFCSSGSYKKKGSYQEPLCTIEQRGGNCLCAQCFESDCFGGEGELFVVCCEGNLLSSNVAVGKRCGEVDRIEGA